MPASQARRLLRQSPRLLLLIGVVLLIVAGNLALQRDLEQGAGTAQHVVVQHERSSTTAEPAEHRFADSAGRQVGHGKEPEMVCATHLYKGRTCLSNGSRLPAEACPLFHYCSDPVNNAERCVQWGAGSFVGGCGSARHRLSKESDACTPEQLSSPALSEGTWSTGHAPRSSLSSPLLSKELRDIQLQFQANDVEATLGFSLPKCSLHMFSRNDILSLLKGKRVLFTGDSMMRQMYIRLIAFLRGETVIGEHYYHTDSYYAINDDEDVLKVMEGLPKQQLLKSGAPLFEMLYMWDPFPQKFKRSFSAIKPDIHFSSFMYWWKGKDPFSSIDGYLSAIASHAKREGSAYQFYFLTTPWTAPHTFGGVEDDRRVPRNEYVASRIADRREAERLANLHVLDFAAFAATRIFKKTPDGIHYMCIWRPGYPKQVQKREQKIKVNGCSDPVNYHWVNVMLNYVSGVG
ncbi:hypothetical protein DIPPA_03911 [Diplonema papillatum]|nr:hypothetical protein DIPPA_03911 [Diplonema papillatum]